MFPFPQANDFDKIVDIMNIENMHSLTDYDKMTSLWPDLTTNRQVDYYLSACMYLGLLNEDKTFSETGLRIRNKSGIEQIIELSRIVVSDIVMGNVYFKQKMLGLELEIEDIIDIMKVHLVFDSEAMYKRRASTVMSWVRWICSHES